MISTATRSASIFALLAFLSACKKEAKPGPGSSMVAADAGPSRQVDAPKDLFAAIRCKELNPILNHATEAFGGNYALFGPRSVGDLIQRVWSVEGTLASELEATGFRGALLGEDGKRVAIAMTMKNAAKVREALEKDLTSHYEKKESLGGTLYLPKDGKNAYLLRADTLFVSRSDEANRAADIDYVGSLVVGDSCEVTAERGAMTSLSSAVASSWTSMRGRLELMEERMRADKNRPADFGEPKAFLAAGDWLAKEVSDFLGGMAKGRFTIRNEKGEWRVAVSLTPGSDATREFVKTMKAVPSKSLLDFASNSVFSAVLVSPKSERAERAATMAAFLGKALKLPPPLLGVVQEISNARGDVLRLSGLEDPASLAWESEVADLAAADKGTKALFDTLEKPEVAKILREKMGVLGTVRASQAIEKLGSWSTLTFAGPRKLSLASSTYGGKWRFVLGGDPSQGAKGNFSAEKRLSEELSLPEEYASRELSFGLLVRKRAKDTSEARMRLLLAWGQERGDISLSSIADERTFAEVLKTLLH